MAAEDSCFHVLLSDTCCSMGIWHIDFRPIVTASEILAKNTYKDSINSFSSMPFKLFLLTVFKIYGKVILALLLTINSLNSLNVKPYLHVQFGNATFHCVFRYVCVLTLASENA